MWFWRRRKKQDRDKTAEASLDESAISGLRVEAPARGFAGPAADSQRGDQRGRTRGEADELSVLRGRMAWSLRTVEHRSRTDELFRGPSWKSAYKWLLDLDRYVRRGLPRDEILRIRDYLEDRAPTGKNRIANAKVRGVVHRLEFMDAATEVHALQLGPDRLPDAWFEYVRNELLIVTPHGWVNPKSVTTWRAGIFVFAIAGTGYYESAVRRGCFLPGSRLVLKREPDNEFDANAVAIYAARARNKAGYVPKLRAKRVARLLDDGCGLVAVSARGDDAGQIGLVPYVIVCETRMFEHLSRRIR